MKKTALLAIVLAASVSAFGQTRSVLVDSNNRIVVPTNFWAVNASNASSTLGLGTAATNSSGAFQPSSSALTNLSLSNGSFLQSLNPLAIANPFSAITATNITSVNFTATTANIQNVSFSNSGSVRTNIGLVWTGLTGASASVIADALGTITNGQSSIYFGVKSTNGEYIDKNWQTLPVRFGTVDSGVWAVFTEKDTAGSKFEINFANDPTTSNSPTTNVVVIRSTNVVSSAPLSFNNVENTAITRTNLKLGWAALTNTGSAQFAIDAGLVSSVSFVAISNGGTGAGDAANARTNLGLGWAPLTNTGGAQFAVDAGLITATNSVIFATNSAISAVASNIVANAVAITNGGTGASDAATARTNLGLGDGYYGVLRMSNFTGYFSNSATSEITNVTSTNLNIWMSNGIITNITE